MTYKYKGKTYNIPDDYLSKQMQILGASKMEAVQMWLEDEGLLENEELNALDDKSKAVKIQHGAGKGERKSVQRERKPNPEKRELIQKIADALTADGIEANIFKLEREIKFKIGENEYSITLTLHRGK